MAPRRTLTGILAAIAVSAALLTACEVSEPNKAPSPTAAAPVAAPTVAPVPNSQPPAYPEPAYPEPEYPAP